MNDGQSSFGGQPVGFGNQPVSSGGQPAVPSGQMVSSGQGVQQPIMPGGQPMAQRPMMMQQQPISSGTGDVVLNSGGGEGNSRKKGAIVAAIVGVVVVAIVLIVLAVVNLNGRGSSGGAKVNETAVQKTFNSYINYVFYGTESDAFVSYEDILAQTPYFESLDANDRFGYVEQATKKYDAFADEYYKGVDFEAEVSENEDENADNEIENSIGQVMIHPIAEFFQGYAGISTLSFDDVLNMYFEIGPNAAKETIEEQYNVSGLDSQLAYFVWQMQEMNIAQLNYISGAMEAGCVVDGQVIDGCYMGEEAEKQMASMVNYASGISSLYSNMYSNAINRIIDVSEELYGAPEESEETTE